MCYGYLWFQSSAKGHFRIVGMPHVTSMNVTHVHLRIELRDSINTRMIPAKVINLF